MLVKPALVDSPGTTVGEIQDEKRNFQPDDTDDI